MASLIEGFEYDIFISYRHNDNLDGWVTDFVQNLEKELKATVKQGINIYFDKNPDDGLLETHSVDKSLEGKLKCLIFIPILSQTYADTNSFAWQYEFCAFIKFSHSDSLTLDIKLANGNVTSRILRVKIHDLDPEDKRLIETEIGGALRAIEFIYKEPGVNRPLKISDNRNDNQNKTDYRNQINKVANAVKEIVHALKTPHPLTPAHDPTERKPTKKFSGKIASLALVALILLGGAYFLFAKFYNPGDESIDKSIAVLPFANMSEDKGQDYFTDGMVEEILNQLVKVRDLKVISRTSSMAFKNSNLTLKEIASELGAAHVVEGSVRKTGNKVRITVQLIEAKSDNHLWSETYDRDLSDIFAIQTEISKNIAKELKSIITPAAVRELEQIPTTSQLAYDYYLRAKQSERDHLIRENREPLQLVSKAIEIDPSFALAYLKRAGIYASAYFNRLEGWENKLELAKADFAIARRLAEGSLEVRTMEGFLLWMDRKYRDALEIFEKLNSEYPNNAEIYGFLAGCQRRLGLLEQARRNHEKSLELDPNGDRFEYARFLTMIREFAKADEVAAPLKGRRYDEVKALIRFHLTANTFSFSPSLIPDLYFRFNRKYDEMLAVLDTTQSEIRESSTVYFPKSLDQAQFLFFKNEKQKAASLAHDALDVLTKRLQQSPDDDRLYVALAYANAFIGKKDTAIQLAKKAATMAPMEADPFIRGPLFQSYLARIYVLCGEDDLAMEKIEWLLTVPGPFSKAVLKFDPEFDALRTNPRFQKILDTEYKIKL